MHFHGTYDSDPTAHFLTLNVMTLSKEKKINSTFF